MLLYLFWGNYTERGVRMSFKGLSFVVYILGHSHLISGESFLKKNQVTTDVPLPFFLIT